MKIQVNSFIRVGAAALMPSAIVAFALPSLATDMETKQRNPEDYLETNPRSIERSYDRFFQDDSGTSDSGFQIPQDVEVIDPNVAAYSNTGDKYWYLSNDVFLTVDEPSYSPPSAPDNFRSLRDNEQLQLQYELYEFE